MSDDSSAGKLPFDRPWARPEPGRIIGKGHTAGDFLEAWSWQVLEEEEGFLKVRAHVPEHVKNPRGQLFGGFTPTYVDMIALFTVRAGRRDGLRAWLATTNMRIDYFEPVTGPEFVLESRLVKERGRTYFVETRFLVGDDDELAVFAVTTLRAIPFDRPLGDA
jgi:acyl-coenzyme A thioesterase PaaI-like protein